VRVDRATTHHSSLGFAEREQALLEGAPNADAELLHRRETLELIRAYYHITDAKTRRKVYELIKSMADKSGTD